YFPLRALEYSSPLSVSRIQVLSGTHLFILNGPSHVGDHLPNFELFVPIGSINFQTNTLCSKVLAFTFLSYHRLTLALFALTFIRAFSRWPAKSSNSSFIRAEYSSVVN